jgi:rhodanese-related sulfurtransferase
MIKPMQQLAAEAKEGLCCLSLNEAKSLIGGCENPLLIDVRETSEHADAAVSGFINIPRGVLEMRIGDLCQDPSRCIVLHCGTGGRAALAAQSLKNMGYENVHLINATFAEIKAALYADGN